MRACFFFPFPFNHSFIYSGDVAVYRTINFRKVRAFEIKVTSPHTPTHTHRADGATIRHSGHPAEAQTKTETLQRGRVEVREVLQLWQETTTGGTGSSAE